MKHYVLQFGNYFFEIRNVKRCARNTIFPETEITNEEYRKLFYSGKREHLGETRSSTCTIERIRIQGNASEILGHDVATIGYKKATVLSTNPADYYEMKFGRVGENR